MSLLVSITAERDESALISKSTENKDMRVYIIPTEFIYQIKLTNSNFN